MASFPDVVNSNAFDMTTLTTAVNKVAYTPGIIRALGIFEDKGISTKSVSIEELSGRVALVASSKRGTPPLPVGAGLRTLRTISCLHYAMQDVILADDVIGHRAFGSATEEGTFESELNLRLAELRRDLEVTLEYNMVNALHGKILDSNGSTVLVNLFTEFGVSETTKDFAFTTSTTDVMGVLESVDDAMRDAIGSTYQYEGFYGIAGSTWFDAFRNHATTIEAWKRWQDGQFLRQDNRAGFVFGPSEIREYRATVSGNAFVNASQCRFFPKVRGQGFYSNFYAPADNTEAVGTLGLPFYALTELTPLKKGLTIEVQTNPLSIVAMPAALIKGTQS